VTLTSNNKETGAANTAPVVRGHRAAVAASFLGWTLDAFDFFLVTFAVTAIAKDFGEPTKAVVASLAITLAFRPVGAFVFGLIADRYGRKRALMIDLVFYAVAEVATGFAHNFTVFLILRALFGIGMGGEWGVGASLAMEKAPRHQRGIFSGLLQEGYACGNLLAALAFAFIFPRWGWRPLFFLGGVPALLAVYVRSFVHESEVWERTRKTEWREYARGVFSHWKLFVYLFIFMALMNFISHGTQDMYPTFLEKDWGMTPRNRGFITAITNVGAIIGGIVFGYLSDRIGRRKSIVMALLLAVLCTPLWAFAPTVPLLIVGGFLMQFMIQGAWGVIPAHINELAPDSVRGFLPGFAYQCGVAIAGTVAYIEQIFSGHMTYAWAMSLTAVTVFILGAIAAWAGKEKHAVEFG
jgi:MFS transporter, SHS family, lactate transporter